MTCTGCASSLTAATLLPADGKRADLRGFRCPNEHGAFLPSDLYFGWRESGEASSSSLAIDELGDDVGDVKRAKLCPQDGRIMTRYRVTSDGRFWLDRCATCGGVWFDTGEWETMASAGLHDQLARIFSDAWQREMESPPAFEIRTERLREAVGTVDLDRLESFREWLNAHPQRDLLTARLLSRDDDTGSFREATG